MAKRTTELDSSVDREEAFLPLWESNCHLGDMGREKQDGGKASKIYKTAGGGSELMWLSRRIRN